MVSVNAYEEPSVENLALGRMDRDQLQRQILTLQYQCNSLQNEKEIGKLSAERELTSLRAKYDKCMNELELSLNDTKTLYEENEQLKGVLKNKELEPIAHRKQIESLEDKLASLAQQVRDKDQNLAELRHELDSQTTGLRDKLTHMQVELDGSKALMNKYSTELNKKVEEVVALQKELNDKEDVIAQLKVSQVVSSHQHYSIEDLQELAVLNQTLKDQISYTKELESLNLKQSEELKNLRQLKDVQNFLKEENSNLRSRLDRSSSLKDKLETLEIENIKLQELVTKWGLDSISATSGSPEGLVQEFSMLQRETVYLTELNTKLELDLRQTKLLNDELALERNQLLELNKKYENSILNLKRLNHELEQQKMLSFEECKLLRQQMDEFESRINNDDDVNRPISSIIDGYKTRTEDLTNELKRLNEEFTKNDEFSVRKRKKTSDIGLSYSQRLNELYLENKKLQKDLVLSQDTVDSLKDKIESLTALKEKKVRILQLRENPLLKEHYIRKQLLQLLQKENEDLLNKKKDENHIPRSVYDRIQFDMQNLEKELYAANKKTTRLKEMFNKKSLEFIEAVNTLLGYKLEFGQHGKVKLIPCYKNSGYLIADLESNTLKSNLATVVPDWSDLFEEYVVRKGEIPIFLSSVMVKLWESNN